MFGLQSSRGKLLKKHWRVQTDDLRLIEPLSQDRWCSNDHEHDAIAGEETEPIAYYPCEMVEVVGRTITAEVGDVCPVPGEAEHLEEQPGENRGDTEELEGLVEDADQDVEE